MGARKVEEDERTLPAGTSVCASAGAARFARLWGAALACLLLTAPASFAGADEWKTIREGAQEVKSVKARFVQHKNMSILTRPLVSKGHLYFRAPDSVRWEYVSPVKTVLMVHAGKVSKYALSGRGEYVADASSGVEVMRVVMQQITGWLGGNFEETGSSPPHWHPGTLPPRWCCHRRTRAWGTSSSGSRSLSPHSPA